MATAAQGHGGTGADGTTALDPSGAASYKARMMTCAFIIRISCPAL
ncbi:hypothetical protein [Sagittula stellata]|nr:hypothetical protein [Sagittula stellata]